MAWTTADIPDQTGRVAVVTGANGGLGLETARALAAADAHVVMAARDQTKAAAAEANIRSRNPTASLEIVALDLASQASIKEAAASIVAAHPRIDILVNNAGLMATPERQTADGYEMQFGVNHLGHWTFTALLLDAMVDVADSRVVTVSSTAHHIGRVVDPANPHLKGKYGPWKAYGQSKLANFHFGLGLQRRLIAAGASTSSLIAHPGLSNTELQATSVTETDGGLSQRFFHVLAGRTGMSPAEGALSQLRAATDPSAKGGEFYGPLFVNNGKPVRKPILRKWDLEKGISRLWEVSESETGVALPV